MRTRKMDADGDYVFGGGRGDYLADVPEAVAQSAATRLALHTSSWFTDTTDGTPYSPDVLGERTRAIYDTVIRARILGTSGLTEITEYGSAFDPDARKVTITAAIDTTYGTTTTTTSF